MNTCIPMRTPPQVCCNSDTTGLSESAFLLAMGFLMSMRSQAAIQTTRQNLRKALVLSGRPVPPLLVRDCSQCIRPWPYYDILLRDTKGQIMNLGLTLHCRKPSHKQNASYLLGKKKLPDCQNPWVFKPTTSDHNYVQWPVVNNGFRKIRNVLLLATFVKLASVCLFRDCFWIRASPAWPKPKSLQHATFQTIGLLWSSVATVFFDSLSGSIRWYKTMLLVYLARLTYLSFGFYKYSYNL